MQEKIQSIVDKYIQNSKVNEILDKDGIIYIMIEVQSEISPKLSIPLEKAISDLLKIKPKLCFVKTTPQKQEKIKKKIPDVKKIIMICSGKGGVGKSTVSSYLAYCLSLIGYKVGLFDADIYGPSIPKIFGLDDEVEIKDCKFIPHEKFGVKLMSMGFIVKSDDALVWRGPMVSKTLNQMLLQTHWNNSESALDYLIIDTPPGTGDVHLSLAENYEIDCAIVVSSPQQLAIANAHRSVDMLKKLGIKLLGVVENMAYILNQDNSKNFIFGRGNVKEYANERGLSLLSQVPLISDISHNIFVKDNSQLSEFITLCEKVVCF